MERRPPIDDKRRRSGTVVDAKASLALWLRAGRAQRGMTIDDVARVTKIQPRILDRLEAGKLDGLPAEVFVRGFVRSFARCVGLDENEALTRYRACGSLGSGLPGDQPLKVGPTARAVVEAMADLAPTVSQRAPAILAAPGLFEEAMDADRALDVAPETIQAEGSSGILTASVEAPASVEKPKRKRTRKTTASATPRKRRGSAVGTPAHASPVPVVAVEEVCEPPVAIAEPVPSEAVAIAVEVIDVAVEPGTWQPKMPAPSSTPSVPWRRSGHTGHSSVATPIPVMMIDDADPESAERTLEDRRRERQPRRTFLPPILLDREDRSARQGGLTLAVIILLIAATLTLSYLMRRPSSSGDGVTRQDTGKTLPGRAPIVV